MWLGQGWMEWAYANSGDLLRMELAGWVAHARAITPVCIAELRVPVRRPSRAKGRGSESTTYQTDRRAERDDRWNLRRRRNDCPSQRAWAEVLSPPAPSPTNTGIAVIAVPLGCPRLMWHGALRHWHVLRRRAIHILTGSATCPGTDNDNSPVWQRKKVLAIRLCC